MKTADDGPRTDQEIISTESPEYVRTSLAAAMTMGKVPGKFFRDAKLYCINLLLTYDEGCHAKCAYCGLSDSRQTDTDWVDHSFIRVDWPVFPLDEVKAAISDGACPHVERVCVSMITLGQARLRGKGVKGPHKWGKYWNTVEEAVEVFGPYNVGVHLIVGVGETEKEIIESIQRAQDMGAHTHLFSFFPEEGSLMENYPQPPLGAYRRVQVARYIINKELGTSKMMKFNNREQLIDFGVSPDRLEKTVSAGEAFMTSGCRGETMDNACNRPFGNCTPYQAYIGHWRNFPFIPTAEDVEIIRKQLVDYSLTYEAADPDFDED
jgi:biotin synthase